MTENVCIKDVVTPNIHFLKQEKLQKDLMKFISENTSKDAESIKSVGNKNSGTYSPREIFSQELIDCE